MNKTLPYKNIMRCVCCDGIIAKVPLDLNDQPLANSYLKTKNETEYRYPLKIKFCVFCTHIQLSVAVDPDLLFENYLYVSGTSNTLKNYFREFVNIVQTYDPPGKRVLDIACNDGSQLNEFKSCGYETYGIDPAKNLYEASSKNHQVICGYFNKETAENIGGTFDVIVAQNVFAHVSNPLEFLEACKTILAPGGKLFIQTSQADMVHNNEFDTIYHEHFSFFSVRSFSRLLERASLKLLDVKRTPVHGTSFLFVVSNEGVDRSLELIKKEKTLTLEIMHEYGLKAKKIAVQTEMKVNVYRKMGYKIVGYGAAAKGNTFLNFANINLDYIVDDNPLKHGLFTPGRRIEIFPPDIIGKEVTKVLLIPLAWNFFDEIKEKVKVIKPDGVKYLKYFPEVEVFDA